MTTNSPYILGVDIGTGSAKTIAVTTAGQIPASRRQSYPTHEPVPGYSEQDPEEVLAAIIKTIRETVAEMGHPPAAIALSSAMHSLLAVDADGEPLTPVMTWADNRAEDYAAALRHTPEGRDIHRATGTPVHPMSPLCKIQWIREQRPEIFDQAACFVGIKDLFLFRCFHEFITDYSLASCSGLFDIRTLDWYAPALKIAGITDERLPIPVETTRLLIGMDPAMAQAMGVPEGTLIMAGSSDGCLAQLGSGAVEPGHAALTIGTSGAIRVMAPQPAADPEGRIFSYVLTPEHYVCGGAMNNGGVALQWFSKSFLPWSDYNDFLKTAFTAPAGSGGLLCLPYMLGERAPVWDSHASGAFVGMRQHHGSPHFQRALVEGICFNLLSIGEALESVTGNIHEVTVSGGFTASPLWIQLLADIFRKPMLLHQDEDASALGAAMLAWHALEQVDAWEFNASAAARVFEPNAEHSAVYQRNYRAFAMLYDRLKDVTDILREK